LKIVEECDHVHFCFAHHRAHKQEVYPSARRVGNNTGGMMENLGKTQNPKNKV
jgi:hypothetical protein